MAMLCASIQVFAYDFDVNGDLFFDIISTAELTCKLDHVNAKYEGSLIIPEKVSFKGRDLTVTTIGSGCIESCVMLKEIKIPNTVTSLEEACFSECASLQSADISQLNSNELSADVFKNCRSLTHVAFPKTVTYLPTNCFYGCIRLSTFEIPTWISRIDSGCFYGCTSLGNVNIPEGVEYIGDNSFSDSEIPSIYLPSTIRALGKETFKNVKLYSALSLPDGLKSIGDKCFYGASIPEISIPSSVESIGRSCFAHTKTKSIKFEEESKITELGYETFESSKIETIKLPSNLEAIGEYCFSNCVNLTKIEFPESLRSLSQYCLANVKLETLTIPVEMDYMRENCFGDKSEFASIKHFIWGARNINEAAYAKYLSLSSESSDITWAAYDLETRSCFLCPIEKFEILGSCQFLSLGIFEEADKYYFNGPLFRYSGIKKLIIDDGDNPLALGSIYSSGNRRKYKLYHYFPDNTDCKHFKNYWMESVDDLYIGREIVGNPLFVPNLKRLHIGKVKKVDIDNSSLLNLEIIESTSIIPPIISEAHFSIEQYMELPVFVPDEAVEAYRNADVWKNFWNIHGSMILIESMCFDEEVITMNINETTKLLPIISPSNASYQNLEWVSSDDSIVSVSEDGTLSSYTQEGEATITVATCDGSGISVSIKVIVKQELIPIETLDFEEDEIVIGLNDSKLLHPIITPPDASIKQLIWSSSTPSIVSVSEDGMISSNTIEGEATITVAASDGSGVSTSINVIVKDEAGVSDILTNSPYKVSVGNGTIRISGKGQFDMVEVFNTQGQRISSSYNNIISINVKGIYIVKIGPICTRITL